MSKLLNHYFGIAYFPKINHVPLDQFRCKYDPTYYLIEDHVALVFLIPDSLDLQVMKDHVESIIENWNSFDIHIKGLTKSWDHWLFLTIKEGNRKLIDLHDQLYTGPLKPYLREDIEYIPHISLGYFGEEDYDHKNPESLSLHEEKYKKALNEAESLQFDFWRKLDHLCLLKFDKDLKSYRTEKKFYLKTKIMV